MIYFSSDFHFGHKNIIKYCNRPFADTDEMDNTIIEFCNAKLNNNDILYIIGDISLSRDYNFVAQRLDKINCKKILINGNHDNKKIVSELIKYNVIIDSYQSLYLPIENDIIFMRHVPWMDFNKLHPNWFHLYGHVHNGQPLTGNCLNVGVDEHNFSPISIREIYSIINERKNNG